MSKKDNGDKPNDSQSANKSVGVASKNSQSSAAIAAQAAVEKVAQGRRKKFIEKGDQR